MGGVTRPSPAFVSARDTLTGAPRKKRGFFRKLGRAFKAVGKGIGRGLRKAAPIIIPVAASFAIPGVGGVLAKGLGKFGKFGKFAGKAVSRGAISAGKRVGRGGRTFGRQVAEEFGGGVGEAIVPAVGALTGDMFHQTAANMPTELLEYITQNNLLPSIAGVAALAQAFDGSVRGPKQNQIFFPWAGDTIKLVWGTNANVLVGKWGWDPTGREAGAGVGVPTQEILRRGGVGEAIRVSEAPPGLPSDPADVPEEWIIWLSQDVRTAPWLDAIAQDVFAGEVFSDIPFDAQQTVVLGLLLES